ncbi:hypothetical protein [Actinomyces trachealis]|uniref:hypothetical protein n=1 Tax=Actinomyces trachealis TaxID=2763540 RepID=UPI001892B4C4|nr:hypothetical protein [Actinomyces trachealis]
MAAGAATTLLVAAGGLLAKCRREDPTWSTVHDGYGYVTCDQDQVRLVPQAPSTPEETHAALATHAYIAVQEGATTAFSTSMLTTTQLRRGSAPNPWEVAWLLWCYTDDLHFYALVLKPNGWELSKEDPAYPGAQRFLASASEPVFPTGTSYQVDVTVVSRPGATEMNVSVDGQPLVTATDHQAPYPSGQVAAYCEDADVTFGPLITEQKPHDS